MGKLVFPPFFKKGGKAEKSGKISVSPLFSKKGGKQKKLKKSLFSLFFQKREQKWEDYPQEGHPTFGAAGRYRQEKNTLLPTEAVEVTNHGTRPVGKNFEPDMIASNILHTTPIP